MDILLIIAGLVVLFFVLGVALLMKGMPGSASVPDAVPQEDVLRAQKELGAAREEEGRLKQQLDTLAVELHQAQSHIQDTKNLEGLLNTLREQDADSQETIKHLDRSLAFLKQKADDQARAAKEVIETLLVKRDALNQEVADIKSRFDEAAYVSVKEENQRLHKDVKELFGQVEEFERQIAQKEKASAVRESEFLSEEGRYKNEIMRLRQGLLQVIDRVRAAGEEMVAVKQSYDLRCRQLQEEKELQRSQSQQEIVNMRERLARLQEQMKEYNEIILAREQDLLVSREKMSLSDTLINELQEQLKAQTATVSAAADSADEQSLREERERLQEDKNVLEARIAELREAHEFLQQKEKILQRELTRSRSEALGFRRICEGYKTRLEKNS